MYLHGLVTISKVVNDRQRLLEARAARQCHIGDQLAYSDDDLNKKERQKQPPIISGVNVKIPGPPLQGKRWGPSDNVAYNFTLI